MKNKEYIKTDVVIVGSGVAGLFAALCLPKDKDVLIITKENTNECDSMLAQGGVCVLKDVNDFKCYFEDTMKAGHWENDPDSVKVMIESSQEVIGTLIDLGVKFDTDKNGEYDYTREETEYFTIKMKPARKSPQLFLILQSKKKILQ